ncbi:MAG: hypothetical protein H6713_21285 [Myxococcales bacterium]|nr:hypothetical protein [Myxococcales bacterium]
MGVGPRARARGLRTQRPRRAAAARRGQGGASGVAASEPDAPKADAPAEPGADAATIAKAPARPAWRDPSPADAGACLEQDARALGVMVSPFQPVAGEPVRVLAATLTGEAPLAVRVEPQDGGDAIATKLTYRPGVPSATIAEIETPSAGAYRAIVGRDGEGLACLRFRVRAGGGARTPPTPEGGVVWPVKRGWDAGEEALYSAWVREMFHAPRGDDVAYRRLDEVTAIPARNLLHNALGWDEDLEGGDMALRLKPDCADTPYFLRAYWSWKRRLPYAFRPCSRGAPGKAPRCGQVRSSLAARDGGDRQPGELGLVQKFMRRTLAWGVHTGNGRTAIGDSRSDLYPVRLDRRGLRPGTVYADPYGHILVLVELMDPDGEQPGVLYAVDGQPDGSITRKRFWEGNFLWNPDPDLGGSGFKQFRPVRVVEGEVVQLEDDAIAADPDYADVWTGHEQLPGVAFYDRMETLITPGQRDPFTAQREAVEALFESAKVRVTSVQNGVDNFEKSGGLVSMPSGYKVFETTGAWESFSTPARDLRLLIAIDVVRGFADKVRRQPEVFGIPEGAQRDAKIEALAEQLDERLATLAADPSYRFTYRRTGGDEWTLSLQDLLDRAEALEVAYNPNDCPEIRWGAPKGSDELRSCNRRAPAEQQAKMRGYRVWFKERRRPPRGAGGPGDESESRE